MGFAGQVFAARVAVGLAMPSPKAFSQAGQMIGGFASKMYGNLRRQNTQAAKKSLEGSRANLQLARAGLEKHSKSQDKFLETSARGAVQRLKSAYKGLGASATAGAGAMKALKRAAPKAIKSKLFANIGKDMSDGKKMEMMMMNFTKLQKAERTEVIKGIQVQKLALKNRILTSVQKEKLGEEMVQLIEDEIKILNSQEEEYLHFDSVRTTADTKYANQKRKLTNEVLKADKQVTEAEKELNQVQKDVAQTQAFIQQGVEGLAVEMKTNFVDAVRESISVLTAFYYKLQENTQELIQFERELLNANSVFRVTNDELFAVGDQVVQFGQQFGLEMQNGAEGLYQLASAGLTASESVQVLNETLKLSMAVQGDHNTISKLVTQTLFGFEMGMEEAALVTDKFAFAIQKSLIEYQDLASAVKFALPFFTSTGQSIDQLLGALQILTNRALEAGIAGRGLRQGVAELAESIGDATANFKQMGVEVVDAEGNMLQLTEIAANFSQVLSKGVINDTELLTTLIQDLNVRGATAFVHLVQSSDEFTEAVEATASAGGELDEMIKVQNESIQAQIQILKNNVSMMFLYNDAAYEGTAYLNAFHEAIVNTVTDFQDLLVVQTDAGYVLTDFGHNIQEVAIRGIKEMRDILQQIIPFVEGFVKNMSLSVKILEVYLLPLKIIIGAINILGTDLVKAALAFHMMNKILPIGTALGYAYQLMAIRGVAVTEVMIANTTKNTLMTQSYTAALITKFFWEKLIGSLYVTQTAAMSAYTAAESYSALVQAYGIVLDEKQALTMTRKEALRLLATQGIVMEAAALKGKEAPQVAELFLENQSIFTKARLWFWRMADATATWYENFSMSALIWSYITYIPLQIHSIALKISSALYTLFETFVTWQYNLAMSAVNYNKGLGIIATILLSFVLIAEAIAFIAASIGAWMLAIPLGIIAAITSPLTLSIGALVLGVIVLGLVFWNVGKRMEEQYGIMFKLKMMFFSFFGMIIWGAKKIVGLFTGMGDSIYKVMEGPLLKMGMWFSHFFKMIFWQFKQVAVFLNEKMIQPLRVAFGIIAGWIIEHMVDPIMGLFTKIKGALEAMRNPLLDIFKGVKWIVKEMIVDPIMWVVDAIRVVLGLAAKAGEATKAAIMAVVNPKAEGGYVTPMAKGGMTGRAPYLVGERGPEIFMPSSAGKIIPNKDLNTQRVDKMLQRAFANQGGAQGGVMVVQNLTVENLDVESLSANKTAMAIDSFAGKTGLKKIKSSLGRFI